MISRRDPDFKKLYDELPAEARKLAVKCYRLWKADARHPSLRFKELKSGWYSVRIGAHYRAVGSKQPDGSIVWTWIGTHEAYNKF